MRLGRSVLKSEAAVPARWSRRPKKPGKWKFGEINFFFGGVARAGAKVIKCEKSGFVPSFGRNGLAVGGEGMRSGRSVLKSAASLPRRWSRRPKRPGKWKTRRNHLFLEGWQRAGSKVIKCRKIRVWTDFRPKWAYRGRRRAEIGAFGTEIGQASRPRYCHRLKRRNHFFF